MTAIGVVRPGDDVMRHRSSDPRAERIVSALVAVAATAIVLWFAIGRATDFSVGGGRVPRGVIFGTDSGAYLHNAHQPIWSWDFLSSRLPVVLVIKLCWYHLAAIVVVQAVAWIAAFAYLERSIVAWLVRPAARLGATFLVWGLAVAAPLLQWTAAIGGWAPIGTRVRWPHRFVDEAAIPALRAAAETAVPDLF